MRFSPDGHLDIPANKLFQMAKQSVRTLVNNYLMVGTPRVFDTYDHFCSFREAIARSLHVHPSAVVVRGSARLGYSIAPRLDKAWRKMLPGSDIDVAIAAVDYFNRLDGDIREWEGRQRQPRYKTREYQAYAKRQQYRSFNCIADGLLPPNTCVPHTDAMQSFDTTQYCGIKRSVTAFVYRDWWSLRNRYEFDLESLCEAVDNGVVPPPVDDQQ